MKSVTAQTETLLQRIEKSAVALNAQLKGVALPDSLAILGSGFKSFADKIAPTAHIRLQDLPHFIAPKVAGHGASLLVGRVSAGKQSRDVCVLTGRIHLYEGHSASDVVFPLRVLARLGVKRVLLTNAAGSVNPSIPPGTTMIIADQLNLTGQSCLSGEDNALGPMFLDMGKCYDPEWRAAMTKLGLKSGVYAGLTGPAYETPAEARMLRIYGADVVGMSTVQEALAARQLGLRVAGLSFVTNVAGGDASGAKLDHQDVIHLAAANAAALADLLASVLTVA